MEQQVHNPGDSWSARLGKEIYDLMWNLFCGARILVFRGSAFERVAVSYDQLFLLVSLYAITVFITSYALVEDPQFNVYGFGVIGTEFLGSLLVGYVIARICGDSARLLLFLVVTYCVTPFFYLIAEVFFPHVPLLQTSTAYIGLFVWSLAISFFIAYFMVGRRKLWAVVVLALWFLVSLPLMEMQPSFWYEGYDYEEVAEVEPIDAERVFYSQYDLLDNALIPIKPGQPGVTDLFFVGFGSYADQDVFMKEVGHIQKAMDAKLGTHERSVTLINNRDTLETVPLASASNLGIVLQHLGQVMNPDEDVLFLYLTSHGSKEHELSVDMWPLGLNDIRPDDLEAMLDQAGIRWRIILVSACYSGGFVEPLKDDHTLIMTAAAYDKTSFGCSNANEYTYFGEALFKDMPDGPYQFVSRFKEAMAAIAEREEQEGLEPSEPQLYIGADMQHKLEQLERDMGRYPVDRFVRRD